MLTSLIAIATAPAAAQPPRTNRPSPPVSYPVQAPPSPPVYYPMQPPPMPPVVRMPPPPPPPPPSMVPTPPRLRSGSIGNADYPMAAQRAEADGTTRVLITVGTDGRVQDCIVSASAGNASLDSTACNLARRRFRFTPATRNGQPVVGTYSQSIRWVLPVNLILFSQGRFDRTVTVSSTGATDCSLVLTGPTFADYGSGPCEDPGEEAVVSSETLAPGHPPVRLRNVLSLLPAGEARSLPRLEGAPFYEWTADVEISAEGRVTACVPVASQGTPPDYAQFPFKQGCESTLGRRIFERAETPLRRARIGSTLFVEVLVPPR